MDLETLDDEELGTLLNDILAERNRREELASLPGQIDDMARIWQTAAGITEGTEYVQPTGAHNAVLPGSERTFEGDLWRNISGIPLAHSPAEYPEGWEKVEEGTDPIEPDPEDYPAWSGDSIAYIKDNIVSHDGIVYECVTPHTSQADWTPDIVAALWNVIN